MNSFLVGLDLGQSSDYTALTIIERLHGSKPQAYDLRHIERFPLGTSYPDQVARVKELVSRAPLKHNATLVVDQTGVGRPVVDMLRQAGLPVTVVAIIIHGGDTVGEEKNQFRVPKRDLVGSLQVLLQSKRLRVAEGLKEAAILVKELLNFKVNISVAGHDSYEAWREGVHDDMVLSTAMACWYGERKPAFSATDFKLIRIKDKWSFSENDDDDDDDDYDYRPRRRW
ncbi:MAG: hypothetical protein HQL64_11705 [Magnetococcales bacterium]|nr:hypothetical protein [Magnetococcales bacterium]